MANNTKATPKVVTVPPVTPTPVVEYDYASSETAYGRTVPASFAIKVF